MLRVLLQPCDAHFIHHGASCEHCLPESSSNPFLPIHFWPFAPYMLHLKTLSLPSQSTTYHGNLAFQPSTVFDETESLSCFFAGLLLWLSMTDPIISSNILRTISSPLFSSDLFKNFNTLGVFGSGNDLFINRPGRFAIFFCETTGTPVPPRIVLTAESETRYRVPAFYQVRALLHFIQPVLLSRIFHKFYIYDRKLILMWIGKLQCVF